MRARFFRSHDTNPHRNLAREEAMLMAYEGGGRKEAMLYLWQNAHTVVIGRNQNAWRECRTAALQADGGTLARRTSGGGAVYHDLGNLNFSFLLPRRAYDLPRQLATVQAAVRSFGIACEFSGRNDLLADGRKFSGNAFRFTRDGALHHGTLMVSVDAARMAKYLQVSKEKLFAKGVQSVPARVVNLSALCGAITIDSLSAALQAAFAAAYGPAALEDADACPFPGYEALSLRNAGWDWNYGATPAFDAALSQRFSWGAVELLLSLSKGMISVCTVYTDAMDTELPGALSRALSGAAFTPDAMAKSARRLSGLPGAELSAWLEALVL